jgi:hypothetical protein
MKFRFVFWDVLPCKVIVNRRFRGTCCLHHQGDEYIPEDKSELHTRRRENLECYEKLIVVQLRKLPIMELEAYFPGKQ